MVVRKQSSSPLLFLLSIAWLRLLPLALAALVNITVDDYYRDPLTDSTWVTYAPPGAWKLGPCDECIAQPDLSRTFLDTWHESLYVPNTTGPENSTGYASFRFEGIAVYVFAILPTSSSSPDGTADMRFVLDGEEAGSYIYQPSGAAGYQYSVPVYVNTSLPAGEHSIQVHNGRYLGGSRSLALLDYIVYTRDTAIEPIPASFTSTISPEATLTGAASPNLGGQEPVSHPGASSTHNATTYIAVGATIGGSLVLTAAIALALRYWKRYKHRRLPPSQQYLRSIGATGGGGSGVGIAAAAVAVEQEQEEGVEEEEEESRFVGELATNPGAGARGTPSPVPVRTSVDSGRSYSEKSGLGTPTSPFNDQVASLGMQEVDREPRTPV